MKALFTLLIIAIVSTYPSRLRLLVVQKIKTNIKSLILVMVQKYILWGDTPLTLLLS